MKHYQLLIWLTQLGISVAVPLALCTLGAAWLRDRFGRVKPRLPHLTHRRHQHFYQHRRRGHHRLHAYEGGQRP